MLRTTFGWSRWTGSSRVFWAPPPDTLGFHIMVTPDSPILPASHAQQGVATGVFSSSVVAIFAAVGVPIGAIIISMIVFGVFVAVNGVDPFAVYKSIYRGAFGTWFSWQNTLQRAA